MLYCIFLLCLLLAPPAVAMEVHDVVGLVQAGIDDNTIMAVIRKTGAAFPLSEEDRRKLRAAGVSERLITFLSNPSAVPPTPAQTGLAVENERSSSPPSGKPAGPSGHSSPAPAQSGTAGLGQGRKESHREPWQGDRQESGRQPTEQSQVPWNQGGVLHPQIMEIPRVQRPAEGRQTLAAIPSREQGGREGQQAPGREVMATITVTDREGAYITGLKKEDVRLYEDGMSREILSLTPDQHTPVSVGILLDTSGSMIDKLDEAKDALRHFVNTLQSEDEVFLFEFNKTPRLVQDFTNDRTALVWSLSRLQASGITALYDVTAAGLAKIREGRHRKKALLLITDGKNNASSRSLDQVVELARRSGVLIYCLGIGHGEQGSFGHLNLGPFGDEVDVAVLQALSGASGGRTFILQGAHLVGGIDVIDQACQQIAAELRLQYTLRYRSASSAAAGAWRSLRVESPRRDLNVRARSGSYGE